MIRHFHGTPIWGDRGRVLQTAIKDGGAFISYARPDQIEQCLIHSSKIAIDNGAFSAWKRGLSIDWSEFYMWLFRYYHHPKMDFFIVPDVIDGSEDDNDRLIDSVPDMFKGKAVPAWHMHESIDRLVRLCEKWPKVAFGSSGKYTEIRTKAWHSRMKEALTEIYGERDLKTKIHGLRMLDGRVLGAYPIDTADSTNLACNVPKFAVKYPDLTRNVEAMECYKNLNEHDKKTMVLHHRCAILRGAIESVSPPTIKEWLCSQSQFTLQP